MGKRWLLFFLLLLTAPIVWAGDEDVKQETPKVERPKEPEPEPEPIAEEPAPEPSMGSEEPLVEEATPQPPAQKTPIRQIKKPSAARSPDYNINYGEILGKVSKEALPAEVRQHALGTRGYRPNLIAIGVGDRTPGVGIMMEYNWNRVGFGVSYSYRSLGQEDAYAVSQSFINGYAYYHWLPFWITPYFLLGAEKAMPSEHSIGGMAGVGIETQIYRGWTMLLGYTYHSAVHKGFLGGSLGWAF